MRTAPVRGAWLWEFGNGDVSHERSGQYVFKEPGRYQVRLQVDHSLEKKQIVKVNRRPIITEATSWSR